MQVLEARDGARPTYEHVLQERREVVWLVDYYGLEWVSERIGGTAYGSSFGSASAVRGRTALLFRSRRLDPSRVTEQGQSNPH